MASSPAVNALRSVLIAHFRGTLVQRSFGACQPRSTRNTVLMNAIHPFLGPKPRVLVAKKVTKAPAQQRSAGIDDLRVGDEEMWLPSYLRTGRGLNDSTK